MDPASPPVDVAILGGGLAGQTLALQLVQRRPETRIRILERGTLPAPDAAFKVGESTVELGAWYLRETLGLRDYLEREHLFKHGVRFFFGGDRIADDLPRRAELGPGEALPVKSHQIDRGRFESDLAVQLRGLGVDLQCQARVTNVEIGEEKELHTVAYEQDGAPQSLRARWVVDASGRASLLKRKLDLERPIDHQNDAVWFRVPFEIDLETWSDDPEWSARVPEGKRRLSTNHLCGRGYWVWVIPLSTGSTSLGIVADPRIHPSSTFDRPERAFAWLAEHEPLLARALEGWGDRLSDFIVRKKYSTNVAQLFSTDRWAMVGDSGAFLDPLYSPGTDFVGLANTFTTALVLEDLAERPIGTRVQVYDQVYRSIFDTWLPVYRDQYAVLGNDRVMAAKVLWDFGLYWAVFVPAFVNEAYTDVLWMGRTRAHWKRLEELHLEMQQLFRELADRPCAPPPAFTNPLEVPRVGEFHMTMTERLEPKALAERLAHNMAGLEALAGELRTELEASVLEGVR